MKITLIINGEKKEFYSHGLTAGASLTAYDLCEELEKRRENGSLYDPEHREQLLRFIVEVFGNQFTEQEFLKGYKDSFFKMFPQMFHGVIAGVNAKLQEFPNTEAPEVEA